MFKDKDGLPNTIFIAISVCLVCSLFVSIAAVALKPIQVKNVLLDRKRNILVVAGLDDKAIKADGGIEKVFEDKVVPQVVNLETGRVDAEGLLDALKAANIEGYESEKDILDKYDPIGLAKDVDPDRKPEHQKLVTPANSEAAKLAGFGKFRENYSIVYAFKGDDGKIQKYIVPIRGKGLWSVLKGFIALDTDMNTIAGITFYEHGETPGLGGEVDNSLWKAQWPSKQAFQPSGEVGIRVVKGAASKSDPFGVDGLSGATITSNGVTYMLHYWLSDEGFKKYFDNLRSNSSTSVSQAEQK